MKTIRGPKKVLDAWLAALRSGKYEQGKKRLECNGAYCCLGVLQMELSGKVERFANDEPQYLPTPQWLAQHHISFTAINRDGSVDDEAVPSIWYQDTWEGVALLNDQGVPFPEIADLIEAHMEYTDS
jgi:hypothetical protein